MIGYNPTVIEGLGTTINTIAQSAAKRIEEILTEDIVTPMSTIWYSPEAVTFFTNFKTTCSSCASDVQSAFDSYRQFVQDLGARWAEETNGPKPEVQAVSELTIDVPITDIAEADGSGQIIMDVEQAKAKTEELAGIEEKMKTEISTLASDLNTASAFIGGGQSAAIENLLTAVCGSISRIFKFLTDGEDSLVGQINSYAQEHEGVAETVSTSATNAIDQVSTGEGAK